jgi:hypothetical protein
LLNRRALETNRFCLTIVWIFVFFQWPAAKADLHIVKSGDTLAKIGRAKISPQVFCKDCALDQILKLNPNLKNPNLIYPGLEVQLPETALAPVAPLDDTKVLPSIEQSAAAPLQPQSTDHIESPPEPQVPSVFQHFHDLRVSTGVNYFRLNATDTAAVDAVFLSLTNPFLAIHWIYGFSNQIQLSLGATLNSVSLQTPSGFTMQPEKFGTYEFDLGINYLLHPKWSLFSQMAYRQELFARRPLVSSRELTLDLVPLANFLLGARWEFFQRSWLRSGLWLKGGVVSGGNTSQYSIEQGRLYSAGLDFKKYVLNQRAEVGFDLAYGQRVNETSIVKQTRTDFALAVGFVWGLGGERVQ